MESDNRLTDRSFWVTYWESKKGLVVDIPANYLFHRELEEITHREGVNNAIELGGFPGYYAVFLRKHLNLRVTLLDYFVHPPITSNLLEANGLQENDIDVVEADLFQHVPQQKYDLVLSCGLIEHFNDTEDIIARHVSFLKPGGTLFVTLPNFRSVNGWLQRTFDRENYDKHNIDCMDPKLLADTCKALGLELVQSRYFGNFSVWLENEKTKPLSVRLIKKLIWVTGKVITKLIPFNSRQLSPYIMVEAKLPF